MSTPKLQCCSQACGGVPTGCVQSENWTDTTYNFPSGLTPPNPDSISVSYNCEGEDYTAELLPNSVMQDFIDSGFAAGGGMSVGDPASVYHAKYSACQPIDSGVGGHLSIVLKPQGCDDEALYDVSWLIEFHWSPPVGKVHASETCDFGVIDETELISRYGLVKHEPTAVYDSLVYSHAGTTQSNLVAAGTFEWQLIGTNYSSMTHAGESDFPNLQFYETYL